MPADFSGQGSLPLGLRNNNPGNLRPSADIWRGETGMNDGFVTFENIGYGIRALAIDLGNAIREGYNTVGKLVSHYAPPSENDTQAYIDAVSGETGLSPGDAIPADPATLRSLVVAFCHHENGPAFDEVPDSDIDYGLSMVNQSILDYFSSGGATQTAASAASSNPGTTALIVLGLISLIAVGKKIF